MVQIDIVVFWYVQDLNPNADCCTVGCKEWTVQIKWNVVFCCIYIYIMLYIKRTMPTCSRKCLT